MKNEILSIENMRKTIKGKNLISKVNFTVFEGEIVGLLGPNGAGKTTVMKCITGLMRVSEGTIEIAKERVDFKSSDYLVNVGAIIEYPAFYEYMTGWKNLEQFARISKASIGEAHMQKVVDLVKLNDVIHDKVKTYSLGMKQRLGLAQALIHNPKLLILDEPMNGLDPRGVMELRDLLVFLADTGVAVIVSSHLLSEIEKIASRVLFIDRGLIVGDENLDTKMGSTTSLEERYMQITAGGSTA